ncbi:MAG: SRPBCC family protein [Acidimicrobiales bacterium]|nr:SRPBCC family protein [Acidimicrobiales bacterium]
MKRLWIHRDIDAPAETVWELLTNPNKWPVWGPTVSGANLKAQSLSAGATGTVTTVLGRGLGFEVTAFEEGSRWAWKVAGIPATDHVVEHVGPDRCRVGFGVPWPAAPYLAVCRVALRRIDELASLERAVT